jgi:hypothetical protein
MTTKYLLLLSVAASSFCVFSTEAFTVASSRGLKRQRQRQPQQCQPIVQGRVSLQQPQLQQQPQHSDTSLNLFPFLRKSTKDTSNNTIGVNNNSNSNNSNSIATKKNKKHKGLQRRLSEDNNEEDEDDKSSNDNYEVDESSRRPPKVDALVELVSLRMRRVSFLSWWAQVILTAVSSVTLLFTRNVLNLEANPANKALLPNYFLAGSSIALSLASVFWTWASRRLSRRLLRKPTTRIQAANMLRKSITVGTCLNLMGMALAILGAEQIVGGLAIKVLTTSTTAPAVYQGSQAANLLQPLDILVVQANTNTLFSHFCSVVAYLFLGRSIGQLDPPSVENDERPRL